MDTCEPEGWMLRPVSAATGLAVASNVPALATTATTQKHVPQNPDALLPSCLKHSGSH